MKAALGGVEKSVSIKVKDPRNTGQNHVVNGDGVEMITIDAMALKDVDFIKFDVEGCEYDAISGAENTLKRCKPVLIVELNGLGKRYGHEDSEVNDLLKSFGYQLIDRVNKDHIYV